MKQDVFVGIDVSKKWLDVAVRPSGTEPVVRYYAEASSPQDLETLLDYGRRWINEIG